MTPNYFRHVLAPGLLAHQKSFHLGIVHYHFTPAGGEFVLILLAAFLVAGAFKWLLGRSGS